jgi:hydroxymethylglutaryl-CoA synthase
MQGAFRDFSAKALKKGVIIPGKGECATDFMTHLLFHIPFPRMVEYASAAVYRQEWRGLDRWQKLENEIGKEPQSNDYAKIEDYNIAESNFSRKFSKSTLFQKAFEAKTLDSASISREVGNIYTGSIFLGLLSIIELKRIRPGDRIGFGAYGSGCSSLVYSGIAQEDMEDVPERGILQKLAQRTRISLEDYENLHEGRIEESLNVPSHEFVMKGVDEQGYRHYGFVD